MKDKQLRGWLEAIRDNLALINLEPSPLGKSTLAQVNELLRLLEANPPLVEVDDLMYTYQASDVSRVWVHFPVPPGISKGSETPVTVTIRRR